MNDSDFWKHLARPFDSNELKFFPAAFNKDRTSAKVAAYIDARAVMDRLDDDAPGRWMTTYRVIDSATKTVECTLTLITAEDVITRADVGYPNEARDADNADKEPFKAAYSDALKRCAVQFGIGRYIYNLALEKDWLPVDQNGRFTEQPRLRGATQQASPRTVAEPEITQPRSSGSTPAAPPPKASSDRMTQAQEGLLFMRGREMEWSKETTMNKVEEWLGAPFETLTKAEASRAIDWVLLETKARATGARS